MSFLATKSAKTYLKFDAISISLGPRRAGSCGCPLIEESVSFDGMVNEEGFATYFCAVCGEENETFVDLSAGGRQSYVEDCAICCRPNILNVTVDPNSGQIWVEAVFEG